MRKAKGVSEPQNNVTVHRSQPSKSIAWISGKPKEGTIEYSSKLTLGVRKSKYSDMKAEITILPSYAPLVFFVNIRKCQVSLQQ
jgi:hypothetical protein